MKLTIVSAFCGAIPITKQWLHETVGRCFSPPELVLVSNGNTAEEIEEIHQELHIINERWDEPMAVSILDYPDPLGSTYAFNRGGEAAQGDVLALLHNDLMVKEQNWDRRVLALFDTDNRGYIRNVGVVGFHGSLSLGHRDLYKVPYVLVHLARGDNFSNLEDAEMHGRRTREIMEVVTLDGMSLIVRKEDFFAWDGLDETYIHHMYDHDLCLKARQRGRHNYLLPVIAKHVSGQTANYPRYNKAFEHLGEDRGVHTSAHSAFYEKWRDTDQLPATLVPVSNWWDG